MKHFVGSTDTSVAKAAFTCLVLALNLSSVFCTALAAPLPCPVGLSSTESAKKHLLEGKSSHRSYVRQTSPQSSRGEGEARRAVGATTTRELVKSSVEKALDDASKAMSLDDIDRAQKIYKFAADTAPGDPRPLFGLARVAFCANRMEQCTASLRQLIKNYPKFLPAYVFLSDLELSAGNLRESRDLAARALKIDPIYESAHLRMAEIASYEQDIDQAIASASRTVALNQGNLSARILLGELYFMRDQDDVAMEQFRTVLKSSPENTFALLRLAQIQRSCGRINAALDNLKQARILAPQSADVLEEFCLAYGARKDWVNAREYAEEWTKLQSDDPRAWLVRGWCCLNSQELLDAAAFLKRAAELAPIDSSVQNVLGLALLEQRKYDDALKCFRRAAQLEDHSLAPRFNIISALISAERWTAAVDEARQVLSEVPDSSEARGLLALACAGDKLDRDAEKFAQMALLKDSTQSNALLALSMVALRQRDYAAAKGFLQKLIDTNPESATALIEMAKVLRLTGNARDSIELLQRALQLAPSNLRAKAGMGEALKAIGNYQGAILHLKECVVRNPGDLELKMSLADAQEKSGDVEAAVETLLKAAKSFPSNATPLGQLARLSLKDGNLKQAKDYAAESLLYDHRCVPSLVVQADLLARERRIDEAVGKIQVALKASPENVDALAVAATVSALQGNTSDALDYLSRSGAAYELIDWPARKLLILSLRKLGKNNEADRLLKAVVKTKLTRSQIKELQKLSSLPPAVSAQASRH